MDLKYYLFHPISIQKPNSHCKNSSYVVKWPLSRHLQFWTHYFLSPLTINKGTGSSLNYAEMMCPTFFCLLVLVVTSGTTQDSSNPFLIWQCFRYWKWLLAICVSSVFRFEYFPFFWWFVMWQGSHDPFILLWTHSSCQYVLLKLVLKINAIF